MRLLSFRLRIFDMRDTTRSIPIDHRSAVYEIEADIGTDLPKESDQEFTMMDLVDAVMEASDTEEEVMATMAYLLRSGQVSVSEMLAADCAEYSEYLEHKVVETPVARADKLSLN